MYKVTASVNYCVIIITALVLMTVKHQYVCAQGKNDSLKKENNLLKKENNLLKKENNLLKKENNLLKKQPQDQNQNEQISYIAKLVPLPAIITDIFIILGILMLALLILIITRMVEIKFNKKPKKNENKNTAVNTQQSDLPKQTYTNTNNENDNQTPKITTGNSSYNTGANTAPGNKTDPENTGDKIENKTSVNPPAIETEIIGYAVGVEPESNIQFKSEILVSAASPPENDKCYFIFKRQANGDITVEYNIENQVKLISYRHRYLSSKIAEYVGEHQVEIKDIIPLKTGKVIGDIESGFQIVEKIKIKLI